MKRIFSLGSMSFFVLMFFVGSYAFADVVAPQDFLAQVLAFIGSFGGLSMMLKISGIIMLVVASMKVSALNDLVWSKLGAAQAWIAPLLGLIAGLLGLGSSSVPTLASVMAYVAAGGGAVLLHELLDTLKALPGIGPMWVSAIVFVEGILGGPSSKV